MKFPIAMTAGLAKYIMRNKLRPRPEWQKSAAAPVSFGDAIAAMRSELSGERVLLEKGVETLARAFAEGVVTSELVRVHAMNDLLGAAERRCDAIASWRALAASRGIALALTGSGPTLFAVADDRADALRMARILGRAGLRARPQVACF